MPSPVLFILTRHGFVRADPSLPTIRVDDPGATAGDGVFESISVIDGRMPPLDSRMQRFAASAAALGLPPPDPSVWTTVIKRAIEEHDPVPRLAITLAMTRGSDERGGPPTTWLLARAARDFTKVRETGVAAVTLDRGYRSDAATTAPWLLLGAKSLSYSANASALREAARRGADDVIFVSQDGLALEGPTSSLIVLRGGQVLTPALESGVLAGTTQATVFEFFERTGRATSFARIPASELPASDALWLVSSVRQAVAVHTLDGIAMPVNERLTQELNEWLSTTT